MAWNQYIDDSFTGRGPTSPGAAGSTTGVGNGWDDQAGGLWRLNSLSQLLAPAANLVANGYATQLLTHPEIHTAQRCVMKVPAYGSNLPNGGGDGTNMGVVLRVQPNLDCYLAALSTQAFYLYKIVGGTPTAIGSPFSVTAVEGDAFAFDAAVLAPIAGVSTFQITMTDLTTSTVIGTWTTQTDNTVELQSGGMGGVTAWSGAGVDLLINEITLYQGDSTGTSITTLRLIQGNQVTRNQYRRYTSTSDPLYIDMVLAADHVTPATGITLTVTLVKQGATSATAPTGTVSEVGGGVYMISGAGLATDLNTQGPLTVIATGTGCDAFKTEYTVY